MELIDKDALVAEIRKRLLPVIRDKHYDEWEKGQNNERVAILDIIDTLEVKDPYEQCVQYASIEDGIKDHAETYSFNIESELFNQLPKEQQALWRKEIEQACISGGEVGVELARDIRYKENIETKNVDLEKEYDKEFFKDPVFGKLVNRNAGISIARHFFELGIKTQKGK